MLMMMTTLYKKMKTELYNSVQEQILCNFACKVTQNLQVKLAIPSIAAFNLQKLQVKLAIPSIAAFLISSPFACLPAFSKRLLTFADFSFQHHPLYTY